MSGDREIQDTPSDRAAVRLIAERLQAGMPLDPASDIDRVDAYWRQVLAPMAHGLSHERLDGHIAWLGSPPAQGDAVAFARAQDLLTLVSQFKAEGDFLHHRVPVEIEDVIFGDDL